MKSSTNNHYSDEDIASAIGLSLVVSPNPAKIFASVEYTLPIGYEQAELQIINAEGKIVFVENVTGTKGQIATDIREFKSGAYIFRLITNKYFVSEPLIIE